MLDRGKNRRRVEEECVLEKRDGYDFEIVDLCRDGVHSIRRGTREDLFFPWGTETAEEGIDCFVGADAYEEVGGREGRRSMDVCVAEVAD